MLNAIYIMTTILFTLEIAACEGTLYSMDKTRCFTTDNVMKIYMISRINDKICN